MIPWERLDRAETPDGSELELYRRGDEFSLRIGRLEVMNSRLHSSEDALAELACKGLLRRNAARVLIGGLGMGFTLSAALCQIGPDAEAVVAEIVPSVVEWNRGPLGEAAGRPLDDARTQVREEDVANVIREARAAFDAIMLDVDNSPDSLIQQPNGWLYTEEGLAQIGVALRERGVLTVWSVAPDRSFTRRLRASGFRVQEESVRAREKRGTRHHIWVARVKS